MHTKQLLGYNDFFPGDIPPTKEESAANIGKDHIQRLCCLMLTYCKHEHMPPVHHLLQMWFTTKDMVYWQSPAYNVISSNYEKLVYTSKHHNFYLLSEEALLNLYIWATHNSEIAERIEHEEGSFMLHLFMLYLLFNNDTLANFQKADDISKKDKPQKNLRRVFAERFPQSDFVNIDYGKLMFTQLVKLMMLLNFLETTEKYQALYQYFLEDFGCSDKEDFFKSLGGAILIPFNPNRTGINELVLDETGDTKKQRDFLNKIAFEPGDVTLGPTDYKFLRDRPLQRADNLYRVVFELFLIKKLYNGIVFKLSGYVNDKPELLRGPFLGEIRNDFSEEVLVYNVFGSIFMQPHIIRLKGTDFKKVNITREPDYYIRADKKVMLVESKDFFITAEEKLSYDFDSIEAGLKKEGRLGKGVLQSATNVGRVLLKQLALDVDYELRGLQIYPVIIVHDSLYNSPGLNYIVNRWFRTELQKLQLQKEYQSVDFSNVNDAIIIDIDSLLLYQKNFEKGELNLFELADEYLSLTSFSKTTDDLDRQFYRSLLSFSDLVRFYTKKRDILPHLELIQNIYRGSGYKE